MLILTYFPAAQYNYEEDVNLSYLSVAPTFTPQAQISKDVHKYVLLFFKKPHILRGDKYKTQQGFYHCTYCEVTESSVQMPRFSNLQQVHL